MTKPLSTIPPKAGNQSTKSLASTSRIPKLSKSVVKSHSGGEYHPIIPMKNSPHSAAFNRERLQKLAQTSRYKNLSFWVPPNLVVSPDECIADVAKTLEDFEAAESTGPLPAYKGQFDGKL